MSGARGGADTGTGAGPDLSAFRGADVVHVKSGRPYRLVRADAVPATDAAVDRIVAICNEPAVYEFLFRGRLAGAPYAAADARRFLAWAADGWTARTHFVFLVLDGAGAVAAAADVKSARLDRAEIGYWASSAHAGVMTPTVAALTGVATSAGYRSLFATVKPANARSAAVLVRNGFVREADEIAEDGSVHRHVYSRRLAP